MRAEPGERILLNPTVAGLTHPWQLELRTYRVIAVDLGAFRLVYIYELNGHASREFLNALAAMVMAAA